MVVDAVKSLLNQNAFYPVVYWTTLIQLLPVVVFIPTVLILNYNDGPEHISCDFNVSSLATWNTNVRRYCFTRHQVDYNLKVPFFAFVIPSISLPIFVAFIYSCCVRKEVRKCCIYKRPTGIESNSPEQEDYNKLDKFYYIHLLIRFLSGILVLILQNAVLFSDGFKSQFKCILPLATIYQPAKNVSVTLIETFPCTNSTASREELCSLAISALNILFSLILLREMVRLCGKSQRFKRFLEVIKTCGSERCVLKVIKFIFVLIVLSVVVAILAYTEILHMKP